MNTIMLLITLALSLSAKEKSATTAAADLYEALTKVTELRYTTATSHASAYQLSCSWSNSKDDKSADCSFTNESGKTQPITGTKARTLIHKIIAWKNPQQTCGAGTCHWSKNLNITCDKTNEKQFDCRWAEPVVTTPAPAPVVPTPHNLPAAEGNGNVNQ